MQKSKFIRLLKSLSKEELKRFEEFVSSPYYNKNSNLVKLMKYISRYSPDYDNIKLERERVYSEIIHGKKFNIKVMKNLMSGLLNLLLKFLELSNYEKNTGSKYFYLLDELLKRNQYSVFSRNVKKAESVLSGSLISEDYFYNNLRLCDLKFSFDIRTQTGMENVQIPVQLIENLFSFFLIYYFKYNYNLLIRKYDYNFNFQPDMSFIENVINHVKAQDFSNKEIILIYYNILMSNLFREDEKYFFDLKSLTEKYGLSLDKNERHNLYSVMQGYCLRKIRERKSVYKSILFDVCKEMVSNGSYTNLDSGLILPLIYKNIVKSGLWAGEFDWTLNFIEDYREKLLLPFQNNVYYYSHALCSFIKGDYERSLEKLSVVKYENVYDKAEVNRLLIQIYYEMGLTDELYSLIDTFKHFLHNDKGISGGTKKGIINFIYFTNTIHKLTFSTDPKWEALQLKKKLLITPTFEMEWLLEKIELHIIKGAN